MKLERKVAVVTGAGRGIGKAIAIRLAEEGARVVISDVDLAFAENVTKNVKLMGKEALAIKADASNWTEVEQMFEQVGGRFGGVDILVNNAGIRRDVPFHKMSEKEWYSVIFMDQKNLPLSGACRGTETQWILPRSRRSRWH